MRAADNFDRPVGVLLRSFPKLSETFVLEEVLALERRGLPLRLYTLAAPADRMTHSAVARVQAPVVQVPAWAWQQAPRWALRHLRLMAASPWRYVWTLGAALARGRQGLRDFARAGWLAGQLREDGVVHLHAHFISLPADVAELASGLGGVPFSISAHAKDIYLSDPLALRRKLRKARFTVTCTDYNCRALRALAPDVSVQRMYHGIDASVFNPARRAVPSLLPMILSVGRLREKKGHDTLIEACGLLRHRGVAFRCEIVGYGDELERLLALIEARGLTQQVQLVGKLTREQIVDRYARAAVYAQPSRVAADGDRDGIPNVLLEAMAMGVPVVATRVSGIPELVDHGRNGLLVRPDDPVALANAMQRLIGAPSLCAELARAARATVTSTFDNDRNLSLLMRLLETRHAPATTSAIA